MTAQSNAFKDHIAKLQEINITVVGRKSGRKISNPIWFVWDGGKLYLLPVRGSDTQWCKNVLKNADVQVDAGGVKEDVHVTAITDGNEVSAVIEKFRDKYGASNLKQYYSKPDVAVAGEMG